MILAGCGLTDKGLIDVIYCRKTLLLVLRQREQARRHRLAGLIWKQENFEASRRALLLFRRLLKTAQEWSPFRRKREKKQAISFSNQASADQAGHVNSHGR
jgi:hypothetical protein